MWWLFGVAIGWLSLCNIRAAGLQCWCWLEEDRDGNVVGWPDNGNADRSRLVVDDS